MKLNESQFLENENFFTREIGRDTTAAAYMANRFNFYFTFCCARALSISGEFHLKIVAA